MGIVKNILKKSRERRIKLEKEAKFLEIKIKEVKRKRQELKKEEADLKSAKRTAYSSPT